MILSTLESLKLKSRFITAMDQLQIEAMSGDLSLKRVFEIVGGEGHGILMLFLCLPFIQPIPIPGLSTPFGAMICLVALLDFLRADPWLPKRFEEVKVTAKVVTKSSEVAEKIWSYAAKVIKQRLTVVCDFFLFRLATFLVVIFSALLLALPLPIPFSNTVPVISIVLCALGYIEKDGLMIVLAYLWMIVVVSFFTAIGLSLNHFL